MHARSVSLAFAALLFAGANAFAQGAAPLQQFLIEREIKGAGAMSTVQLREASQKSNSVLRALGPDIQWVHSYVAGDKIYCVYNAPNERAVREHAQRGGFPANRIERIRGIIDPTTAE